MKKLLLADDSVTIQKVVRLSFADENIEIITADNGEQAVSMLEETRPDIILADVYMPGRNGFAVCEYVKSHPEFSRIPVVLLVGIFEPFDKSEASRVLSDGVLTKPFETSQLIHMVRELLDAAKAKDAEAAPADSETLMEETVKDATPANAEAVEVEDVLSLECGSAASVAIPSDEDSILEIFDEELEAALQAARAEPQPVAESRMVKPEGAQSAGPAYSEMIPVPAPVVAESEVVAAAPVEIAPVQPSVTALTGGAALGESEIDLIVERVLKKLSDRVVREVAWELVPDMAEMLIKERLKEQQLPR